MIGSDRHGSGREHRVFIEVWLTVLTIECYTQSIMSYPYQASKESVDSSLTTVEVDVFWCPPQYLYHF
jgi:hypothetical protein